jgi:Matrixin
MNRRTLICAVGSLVAVLPASAYAQSLQSRVPSQWPWKDIPSIVVLSSEHDSRLPAVREAVDFWNAELSKLGSPFRLGAIRHVVETIPASDLYALRPDLNPLWAKESRRSASPVDSIRRVNGDIIVALSDASLNSFTLRWPSHPKVLVAIQRSRTYPLTLPKGAANVIAHELGHAIGLGHNNDEGTLMCGTVWCRLAYPDEGFFPLTKQEEIRLLEMYPPSWQAEPSRTWKGDPPPVPTSG